MFGEFQQTNCLLTRNCREFRKKVVDRVARLKAVHEGINRHACATKNRRAIQNLR